MIEHLILHYSFNRLQRGKVFNDQTGRLLSPDGSSTVADGQSEIVTIGQAIDPRDTDQS